MATSKFTGFSFLSPEENIRLPVSTKSFCLESPEENYLSAFEAITKAQRKYEIAQRKYEKAQRKYERAQRKYEVKWMDKWMDSL